MTTPANQISLQIVEKSAELPISWPCLDGPRTTPRRHRNRKFEVIQGLFSTDCGQSRELVRR